MVWFVLSVLTAFSESLKDVFSKRGLKSIDEYVVSWSLRFFAFLFLVPLLFFIEIPSLNKEFWVALCVSGLLNLIATVLYMKAIKHSDLSLTVPMVTFTPLFLLITSPIILGEVPTLLGLLGVLLIVYGSYAFNIKQWREGYLAPFKALLKEPGPRLMLMVAFIWSITTNFDKIGVQNSSPIFWSIAINAFIAIFLLPVMLKKSEKGLQVIRNNYKVLLPVGFFTALTVVLQMTAISLIFVAYVISIKRTSVIISVLFGYFIFKEKNIKERLLGSIIMVIGVVLILLS